MSAQKHPLHLQIARQVQSCNNGMYSQLVLIQSPKNHRFLFKLSEAEQNKVQKRTTG